MIHAMRQIFNGNVFLSERMTGAILNKFHKRADSLSTSPVEVLTNRELEVFTLIGNGMVPAAIAQRLHLSAKTVYSHTERIKDKLGIRHSPELVRFAALGWKMAWAVRPDDLVCCACSQHRPLWGA